MMEFSAKELYIIYDALENWEEVADLSDEEKSIVKKLKVLVWEEKTRINVRNETA